MAKKWIEYTKREKVIGVLAAGFAVFAIGGIGNAMSTPQSATSSPTDASTTQVATPVTTYKDVVETEAIPYAKESINDSSRASGTSAVTTAGADGVKTKTFKVTYVDGVETARELASEVVTTPAVNEVTSVGTYVAPAPAPAPAASTSDSNSGATAKCRDGSLSYSAHRSGTCSHHGGVSIWY